MPAPSILAHRILGKPLDPRSLKPRIPMYAEGDLTDPIISASPLDPHDNYDSGGDYSPYAYDQDTTPPSSSDGPGDQGASNDSGPSTPSSNGNVRGADPLPSSSIPLHYYGGAPPAGDNDITRYQDYVSHPADHGADPKSSVWRRLGGAVVDTAGTWASGFGVPRAITHHLAQDIRYGPDAAHAKENYQRNLPLMRDAAQFENEREGLDYKNRALDENTQTRLLHQQQLDMIGQQNADTRQEQARTAQEKSLPGFQPLPQAAPPITTQLPLAGTGQSIPMTTGGMTPAQQVPPGYRTDRLMRTPTQPAQDVMVPSVHNDWPVISPEMADALPDMGLKAGTKIDPQIYKGLAAVMAKSAAEPKLRFEHFTNENTGDVTTVGFDPTSGTEKSRSVIKGVAKKRPQITNVNTQEANDPATIKYYVDQMKTNPDIFHDLQSKNAGLAVRVAQEWSKQTNLPQPIQLDAQTRTMESGSQNALQHVANVRKLLADPDIQKRLGPLLGRLGNVEQDVGSTVGLTDEEAQKAQDLRASLTYLFLREGKALFGGRPPEKLMEHLMSTSPKVSEDVPMINGALKAIERSAKSAISTAEKQRFGGKTRPGFTPGYEASEIATGGTSAPPKPIVQQSPSTKKFRYSLDGGKTWQPGQPPAQ